MKAFFSFLVSSCVSVGVLSSTALAKGVASVTSPDGEVIEYEVGIASTDEMLFVKYSDTDLFVLKKDLCQEENNLQVCKGGEASLEGHGVSEAIAYEQLVVFTNTTAQPVNIPGSKVTLEPTTVLLEVLTADGRYATIMGKIDSAALASSTPLKEGVATITAEDGEVTEYQVAIASTNEKLYVKYSDADLFVLEKADCRLENQLQVCQGGTANLVGYGVSEEIPVESLFVFTNTTAETVGLPGSAVTMSPNTVLLEILTETGRYATVMGKIAGTNPDELSLDEADAAEPDQGSEQ